MNLKSNLISNKSAPKITFKIEFSDLINWIQFRYNDHYFVITQSDETRTPFGGQVEKLYSKSNSTTSKTTVTTIVSNFTSVAPFLEPPRSHWSTPSRSQSILYLKYHSITCDFGTFHPWGLREKIVYKKYQNWMYFSVRKGVGQCSTC